MPPRKLFLAHHNKDAPEVRELAIDLRVRGIVPWIDKERGGFGIADESEPEARRVLREDCLGLLLYATREAFKSDFIRDVEIDEANQVREKDPSFLLFTFAREMGFGKLKQISQERFGFDLSAFHGVAVGKKNVSKEYLRQQMVETARLVLEKVVSRNLSSDQKVLSLQISTRDLFPDNDQDLLRLDATQWLRERAHDQSAWQRLLNGLVDIKREIARACGRPRLIIHGSKHLTAAFMIGRVFSPFELEIRQTSAESWHTDVQAPLSLRPLVATFTNSATANGSLVVGVASRNKDVDTGIAQFVRATENAQSARLVLLPRQGPLDVNNEICVAMASQTYAEIETAMQGRTFSSIHLFAAAPQAFMMMLGRQFKGMPPVSLYEWTENTYRLSAVVPAEVS